MKKELKKLVEYNAEKIEQKVTSSKFKDTGVECPACSKECRLKIDNNEQVEEVRLLGDGFKYARIYCACGFSGDMIHDD